MANKLAVQKVFDSFNGKKVLVIGDVMIDSYIWGKVDRISPEAPVPVVAVKQRENRLGGAANVALNIRNLGGVPYICSVTGKDEKGDLLKELLQKQGLSAHGIIQSHDRITTVKFRIIGNNAQMLRVDEESGHLLNDKDRESLFQSIEGLLKQRSIDAVVFEDYDKGVLSPELIKKVVGLSRAYHIPVAVDPKKNNFLAYEHVDLFKPNLKELQEGLKLDTELSATEDLRAAARMLHDTCHINTLMVTLSDKGIFLSVKGEKGESHDVLIPAHFRSIADVSGAGDTVIGTAAMCLAAGIDHELMAAICNLAGGIVCEQVGVIPIDRDKLLQEAFTHLIS